MRWKGTFEHARLHIAIVEVEAEDKDTAATRLLETALALEPEEWRAYEGNVEMTDIVMLEEDTENAPNRDS